MGLKGSSDEKIVELAIAQNFTIITQDLDYGEIYYNASSAKLSIIIVRSKSQWYENVNNELEKFLKFFKIPHSRG